MSEHLAKLVALQLATWDGDAVSDKHDERARRLIDMMQAHQDGVEKYGQPNFARNEVPPIISMAVEFGFKQCEKGNNLEAALSNMRKLYE